jgi:uncharacterized protein YdiU (UPF0061 family)
MQSKFNAMWAAKLGLKTFDTEMFRDLVTLMEKTPVDYTVFFRELSYIPDSIEPIIKSFYKEADETLLQQWTQWLEKWHSLVSVDQDIVEVSQRMKQVNPKYTWREWLVAPAYQQAMNGDYSLVHELQEVLTNPYDEQSKEVEDKYYALRPQEFFHAGGISHYSCSS